MKSKGLEVHYNATGKAYTHEEFKALAKDADALSSVWIKWTEK